MIEPEIKIKIQEHQLSGAINLLVFGPKKLLKEDKTHCYFILPLEEVEKIISEFKNMGMAQRT